MQQKLTCNLADDLSMFFATGVILYRVMSFGRSSDAKRKMAYSITVVLSAIGVYHCLVVETIVHQGTFVLMVMVVAFRTANLIKTRIKVVQVKERMNRLARTGVSMSFGLSKPLNSLYMRFLTSNRSNSHTVPSLDIMECR